MNRRSARATAGRARAQVRVPQCRAGVPGTGAKPVEKKPRLKRVARPDWARWIGGMLNTESADGAGLAGPGLPQRTWNRIAEHGPLALGRPQPGERFEIHSIPRPGTWLSIAAIELRSLLGQCLNRRIEGQGTVRREIAARDGHRGPPIEDQLALHHLRPSQQAETPRPEFSRDIGYWPSGVSSLTHAHKPLPLESSRLQPIGSRCQDVLLLVGPTLRVTTHASAVDYGILQALSLRRQDPRPRNKTSTERDDQFRMLHSTGLCPR